MNDTQQKAYIKLLRVGAHEEAVLSVLSKIQGLQDSPERLIAGVPCYISGKVPLPLAEKVKTYLEKAGATVHVANEDAYRDDEPAFAASHIDEGELPLFDNPAYTEPAPIDAELPADSPASFETDVTSFEVVAPDPPEFDAEPSPAEEVLFDEAAEGTAITPASPGIPSRQTHALPTRDYSEAFTEIIEKKHEKTPAKSPRGKNKKGRVKAALALAAFALLGGGLWLYFSGGLADVSQKFDRGSMMGATGVLTVENAAEADLKLYHVVGTRVINEIPFDGESARLQRGDYYLEAVKGREVVRFPVYIGGRGHRLTIQVVFPPTTPVSSNFAYIPDGWFRMGNKETDTTAHFGFPDESPDIDVYVSGFFLSKYEVTNKEYREFVEDGGYYEEVYWQRLIDDWPSLTQQVPSYEKAFGNDGWNSVLSYIRTGFIDTDDRPGPRLWEYDEPPYDDGHDNRPVVGVTMYEADAYCRWMTERTGKLHRLPTESEWEKAARGYEGYFFSYGNEYDGPRANTESQTPRNVGSYPPNSYGVYDITGNVWEWVSDHYDAERYQLLKDRDGDDIRDPHAFDAARPYGRVIVRGGSFRSVNRINARTPVRYPMFPNDWHTNIGFRYIIVP